MYVYSAPVSSTLYILCGSNLSITFSSKSKNSPTFFFVNSQTPWTYIASGLWNASCGWRVMNPFSHFFPVFFLVHQWPYHSLTDQDFFSFFFNQVFDSVHQWPYHGLTDRIFVIFFFNQDLIEKKMKKIWSVRQSYGHWRVWSQTWLKKNEKTPICETGTGIQCLKPDWKKRLGLTDCGMATGVC